VIVDETDKIDRPSNPLIYVPLIGVISANRLTSSQGYSIITNDMHGKPRKTAYYRQDSKGNAEPVPVSWVQYNYMQEERAYDGKRVLALKNTLKQVDDRTVEVPSQTNAGRRSYTLGQENEFFLDMRESQDDTWVGGVQANVDVLFIPLLFVIITLPFPVPWPNVSKN